MKLGTIAAALATLVLFADPASAGTKTVPASAFKPVLNYPSGVAIFSTPVAVGVFSASVPDGAVWFSAEVKLPVGARITRVRYLYTNGEGRAHGLKLSSYTWGAAEPVDRATLSPVGAAADPTEASTTAIYRPTVKSGETYAITLTLAQQVFCYGVKIDYQ